jgi:GTP-binding protein HflX
MFATLDPTSRRLRLPRDQEVIINDTVGFIRDLPPDLITAFRATLEEMESSDILLHLVDASSPHLETQIGSVVKILEELNLSDLPRLLVFNKSDLLSELELRNLQRAYNAVVISALDRQSLVPMVERVGEMLDNLAAGREIVEGQSQFDAKKPAGANR